MNNLFYAFIFSLSVVFPSSYTLSDVRPVARELFTYHVDYHRFDESVALRSLSLFLEECDPEGLYFLHGERSIWTDLPEGELRLVVSNFEKENYDFYKALLGQMQEKVARARLLRQKVALRFNEGVELQPQTENFNRAPAYTVNELEQKWEQDLYRFVFTLTKDENISLKDPELRKDLSSRYLAKRDRSESAYLTLSPSASSHQELLALLLTKSLAKSLDAHTAFYTPKEASDLRVALQKQFCGIGVVLREGLYGVKIASVVDGGPAKAAGSIQAGDEIIAINGKKLEGDYAFEEVAFELKGPPKSVVFLTLRAPDGSKKEVKLVREKILLKDELLQVKGFPYKDGSIGVLSFDSFYDDGKNVSLEKDVQKAMKTLSANGPVYGVILDMRENAGGFLHQALRLCSLYVPQGVVVIARYAGGKVESTRHEQLTTSYRVPVIALTSKASASAAEVVAQTLQDYGVGLVVGDTRTYGKGTMQIQTVTDDLNRHPLKITVGRYYTISGVSPQLIGVKADLEVPTHYTQYPIGEEYLEFPLKGDRLSFSGQKPSLGANYATQSELSRLYLYSEAAKESGVRRHLSALKSSSQKRLLAQKEIFADLKPPVVAKSDPTLEETVAIMKDLIALEQKESKLSLVPEFKPLDFSPFAKAR